MSKAALLKCSESPIFLPISVYLVEQSGLTSMTKTQMAGACSPLQTWSISLPTLTTADLVYISPNRTGSSTSGVVTLTSLSKAANYLKNTTYCVLHEKHTTHNTHEHML